MLLASTTSAAAEAKAGRVRAATQKRRAKSMERRMARLILCTLLLPFLTIQPVLDMNGMNRAANQLSRKVMADQDHGLLLKRATLTPGERHAAGAPSRAGA